MKVQISYTNIWGTPDGWMLLANLSFFNHYFFSWSFLTFNIFFQIFTAFTWEAKSLKISSYLICCTSGPTSGWLTTKVHCNRCLWVSSSLSSLHNSQWRLPLWLSEKFPFKSAILVLNLKRRIFSDLVSWSVFKYSCISSLVYKFSVFVWEFFNFRRYSAVLILILFATSFFNLVLT